MKRIDPWNLLGVKPGDLADTLKAAYKLAMLKAHPDRGGSTEAASDINKSYEFLSTHLVDGRVPGPHHLGIRPMFPRPPIQRVVIIMGGGDGGWPSTGTSTTSVGWSQYPSGGRYWR